MALDGKDLVWMKAMLQKAKSKTSAAAYKQWSHHNVVRIFFLVGNWGQWTPWTTCTATSGKGSQARTRLCNNPPPSYGGSNCVGSGVEIQLCNLIIGK